MTFFSCRKQYKLQLSCFLDFILQVYFEEMSVLIRILVCATYDKSNLTFVGLFDYMKKMFE